MQHEITCQQSENAEGNAEASESLFPPSATESLVEGQKRCAKCKLVKPMFEFFKRSGVKDGRHSYCRVCAAEMHRRRLENPETRAKITAAKRRWLENPENRASLAEAQRRYRRTLKGKAKQAEHKRRYLQNPDNRAKKAETGRLRRQNPEFRARHAEYLRRRRQTNPQARLANRLRVRLHSALKGARKSAHTLELLGCQISDLVGHLESKFKPGMTWENHGKWHIDHIMPLASFDLSDPEQQRMACHWTNLQPLWADENMRKWAKVLSEK